MSWDVSLVKFDRFYRSFGDMPDDVKPLPLGPAAHVRDRISEVFPGTDWTDPAWGMWAGPMGSIEFNMGKNDPVESFMLHVRAGDDIVAGIVHLTEVLECWAYQAGNGELLEVEADGAAPGLAAWRDYRDRVLDGQAAP